MNEEYAREYQYHEKGLQILIYARREMGIVGRKSTIVVYGSEGYRSLETTYSFYETGKKDVDRLFAWALWNDLLPPKNWTFTGQFPQFYHKHGNTTRLLHGRPGRNSGHVCNFRDVMEQSVGKLRDDVRKEILAKGLRNRARRALKRRAEMGAEQLKRVFFYEKIGGLNEDLRVRIGGYM